jgi:opacity protein-like surface antigen
MQIPFHWLITALFVAVAPWPAAAQTDYPRVELFGGYSYLPANGDDYPRQASHGFQASLGVNLTRWFGIAGDFGGQYDSSSLDSLGRPFPGVTTVDSSVYEYLVAPRFTLRRQRVSLFVHGLVGGATGHTTIGFSDSAVAFGAGGGADVGVTSRLAVRAQFDLLGSFADIVEDNSRLAVGLAVRLGP